MWKTVRRRLVGDESLTARRPRSASLQLRVPSPYGGEPWISATIAVSSVPATRGETIRIRAHVDSCLQAPATPGGGGALGHGEPAATLGSELTRYGRDLAASATRRLVNQMPRGLVRRLAEQRRRSWLDMQISTAPLDAGAAALMPAALRERYGEQLPQAIAGAPRVGVWSGPAGGPLGGVARLAMVQFDDRDLDAEGQRDDGERFSLNIAIGELIEPVALRADERES